MANAHDKPKGTGFGMKLRDQAIFWLAVAAAIFLFVWLFKDVLLPFVVGIIIAYLLNPIMVLLGKHSIPRMPAAILILVIFAVLISVLALLLIPPLYKQTLDLAETAPRYIDSLWEFLQPFVGTAEPNVSAENSDENMRSAIKDNIGNALSASSGLLGSILNGGFALARFLTFLVVTPLVAFFMLIELQTITQWVYGLLPRQNYDATKEICEKIDHKIAGFIRGQLVVALILGVIYSIALTLAGLRYGFLIGIVAGLLSIIPLFGSTVGLLAGVIVAWFQQGDFAYVAIIAGIFLAGQFLEGNFISPKVIGDRVGLHPLWILFALMAGATLLGIVGMLIAVPVAAAIGVLTSAAITRYKDSHYYDAE